MEYEKKKNTREEMDDFWDIDALIPQRRLPHASTDTSTTEIIVEARENDPGESAEDFSTRRYIPPHNAAEARVREAEDEYAPQGSLIKRVRIFRPKSSYHSNEAFLRDAKRLQGVRGRECPHVTFFSYVPQYAQMERAQLEWYLWWRENFKNGVALPTDYSYLLLYAYEVINLAETLGPKDAQKTLSALWREYRDLFHQLDLVMPEWICDLSLIYHLPPPDVFEENTLYAAMSRCVLKEFYISAAGENGLLRGLLLFCSNYDYRKSKFYTAETKLLFDRMILGAARYALERMSEDGTLLNIKGMDTSRMVRDSYNGAVCAYQNRRQIAIEYRSFTRSNDLCYLITDIVKYTENQIRASLGIRSRLSIYALPAKIRTDIGAFLAGKLPQRTPQKKNGEDEAAYAHLYDIPKHTFSKDLAQSIERESWTTTERLVEAFEEESVPQMSASESAAERARIQEGRALEDAVAATEAAILADLRNYLPFLSAVLRGDVRGQRKCAAALNVSMELAADRVNEIAAEHMGDILLEEGENGFSVLEDYTDTVRELLDVGKEKE